MAPNLFRWLERNHYQMQLERLKSSSESVLVRRSIDEWLYYRKFGSGHSVHSVLRLCVRRQDENGSRVGQRFGWSQLCVYSHVKFVWLYSDLMVKLMWC